MTERRPFYHDGMRALQDRFDGRRVADGLAAHRRRYDFWPDDRAMIETTPFFFIATSYGDYTDCSMRSGMPGFVKIVAPGTIEFPEYDGNSMYRTLGNIKCNQSVGLLFVKFDGKLIHQIGQSQRDDALLAGLAKLCAEMKVDTIAEWIESETMAKAALGLGFRHGQGRWMGPPLAEIPIPQPVGKRKGVRESWG